MSLVFINLGAPLDVACGRHVDLLPIVVVCSSVKEAFKVDYLNSEVFAGLNDSDDADEIFSALESSRTVHKIFASSEKIYAFRVAMETGIYAGIPWHELQYLTKYKNSQYRGCETFLDALRFMLDKSHLCDNQHVSVRRPLAPASSAMRPTSRAASPYKETSRAPSPVKATSPIKQEASHGPAIGRGLRSGSPEKALRKDPPHTTTSPSKAFDAARPEAISRTTSLPVGYTSSRGFPLVSASTARRPAAGLRAMTDAHLPPEDVHFPQSASARFPTSSTAQRRPDVDDTFVDHLDRLNLDLGHSEAPLTMDLLRRLVRPPPEMLTGPDNQLPALDLGPDVDGWLANRNVEPGDLLRYLQAFLWAPAISDFVRMVGRPGPAELRPVDAEYLWSLLSKWLDDGPQ
ncbi:hypothetical protein PYCCODRAFT_1472848 [Trametes coccinea BRFM310]|uniref:Uncharacterized protein n=1 Tax=Trametes coccinea (strain BRFM310) TaxID=1353009 RepID=A0A1Y2I685_TRAC3|nr:hypothetical protein PYCCODRAFT_1472848 [Trametes coccinea BRFM310]